jgi:two-component system OmpR family sensor kinase
MKSIRRELLVTLLATVLIAGALAALAVYYKARAEIGELLDYQLRQMALSLRDESFQGSGVIEPPPFGFDYAIQISSEDGITLHYSRSRVRIPANAAPGYATMDSPEGLWRMYTLRQRGLSVQVAQPMSVRNGLAADSAWRTMAPFILLVPALALFVWFAVARGLRPLEAVAEAVKARSAEALDPLPHERLPEEIKPVVLALNDLLPRLSHALETQRAFVADAAHELRTPLSALRLQLQLAERARDEAERAAAFDTLREGLARATRLVEQLLTLARQDPASVRPQMTRVDLGELAAEAVGAHDALAQSKGIDLGLARRDGDLAVTGERDALRTLLSNLIDNAVRYTPGGGRVDVSVLQGGSGPLIEVTDTGPGIPVAERERVFDRFYRRADSGVPGSGLGLAIVRSVAERHGARVELGDGPGGKGLTVRVAFQGAPLSRP